MLKDKEGKEFIRKEIIERNFNNFFRKLDGKIAPVRDDGYFILIPVNEKISTEENNKLIKINCICQLKFPLYFTPKFP